MTIKRNVETDTYSAPGLIDLQVNGLNGVDFNDLALTKEGVLKATEYAVSRGVTTYFPTLITNSVENLTRLFKVLEKARNTYSIVKETVGGYHLEGPFISPKDGAKGAHDAQYIQAPDWKLFEEIQNAASGNIKIVTIAPEWEGSVEFIKKCRENNVLVSMGHSLAETNDVEDAVRAGLSLSTHLGNGIPLMIKRHPNLIWDQLAEERLTAMIIVDGHHIPDHFIQVVLKAKGGNVVLVSDTTQFAGMPPGEYDTFIGGKVVLSKEKRLSVKDGGGILAGAAKDLLECVETISNHQMVSLDRAWEMASVRVLKLLNKTFPNLNKDMREIVEFQSVEGELRILKVVRNEKTIFEGK